LEAKQINSQHSEHAGVKGDPEPEIRMHQRGTKLSGTTRQFVARALRRDGKQVILVRHGQARICRPSTGKTMSAGVGR
jgi:hypothetical protein